jgi:hypothetical protein
MNTSVAGGIWGRRILGTTGTRRGETGGVCLFFLFIIICCTVQAAFPVHAAAFEEFRIGTGGSTGVYYPIGRLIATGMTKAAQEKNSSLHGIIGVAQNSAGSIENAENVANGSLDAGMVQADIAASAYHGLGAFHGKPLSSLRAVASLYSEKFQIVVRADSGIYSVADLRGRKISVDERGSGTQATMKIVLSQYGMSLQDLDPLYLKPVYVRGKIAKGELQGFVMMAGVPMEAVTDLMHVGLHLVPIEPKAADAIYAKHPYLHPGEIPAGSYPGLPAISTLEVYALLIVNASTPKAVVHALTKSIFSDTTLKLLREGHPQGKSITLKTALNGLSIPLHPGAEKFYREIGLLK